MSQSPEVLLDQLNEHFIIYQAARLEYGAAREEAEQRAAYQQLCSARDTFHQLYRSLGDLGRWPIAAKGGGFRI